MKLEDVPEFFREQVKITKEHVGRFGVNNVFKKIDLSEISDVTSFLFDEEEMQKVEEKARVWNISYNGEGHQDADRIFWFYILAENGARKMHTCNHRQFDSLLNDYEFVDYHDYKGLGKSTEAFQYIYEEIARMNAEMGQTLNLEKMFPLFRKRLT
jgi:hypothetical protein